MSDPSLSVTLGDELANYVAELVAKPDSIRGQLLRGGGPVAAFESALADRCGFPYCVATSSATSALQALAHFIEPTGHEVWLPADHWEGTAAVFRSHGAVIHYYQPNDGTKFPDHFHLITNERSDDRLPTASLAKGSLWIEDSNRIPGITADLNQLSPAPIQILSFGPGKPLCCGEGGAMLCRSKEIYETFLKTCTHPERVIAELGIEAPPGPINARIHPLAAIIGLSLLR